MVIVLCACAAPGWAGQCPPAGQSTGRPDVNLTVSTAEATTHNSRSRDEITAMAGHPAGAEVRNSGLTRSRSEFRVEPSFRIATYADGGVCVMLTAIKAKWVIVEHIVDIAREFAPGTCQYREVKAHEDEHVRINEYTFRQHVPLLEARLKREVAQMAPVAGRDAQALADQMTKRLSTAAGEVLGEFRAALKQRNGAIDTPESYRAVSKKCPKW